MKTPAGPRRLPGGGGSTRKAAGVVLGIALLGLVVMQQNLIAVIRMPLAASPPAGHLPSVTAAAIREQEPVGAVNDGSLPEDCEASIIRREVEFSGTRHFFRKCLAASRGSDRLNVVDKSKLVDGAALQFLPGTSFLVRDVCALGHFPKDLTHLHTYQELAAAQRRSSRTQSGGVGEPLGGVENVSFIIVGHVCATLDARRLANKRTPVFHQVLVHWVRAITGEADFLQAPHFRSQTSRILTYEDFVPGAAAGRPAPVPLCFEHLAEREEKWRWFPSPRLADSFREKMWRYLGVDYEGVRQSRRTTPFAQQPKLKVVVLRRDEDRHFDERRAAAFLHTKFGKVATIRFEQYDSPPDPKKVTPENNITVASHVDQLKQLFDTDVLIAAHGAGLSSIVVMQPGSVVIELFPNDFRYYMYEELARVLSLNYVSYESEVVAPANCCRGRKWVSNANDDMQQAAAAVKAGGDGGPPQVELVHALHGKRDCKKCDIVLPEATLYQLVKNALATVWLRNSRLSSVHDFDVRR